MENCDDEVCLFHAIMTDVSQLLFHDSRVLMVWYRINDVPKDHIVAFLC